MCREVCDTKGLLLHLNGEINRMATKEKTKKAKAEEEYEEEEEEGTEEASAEEEEEVEEEEPDAEEEDDFRKRAKKSVKAKAGKKKAAADEEEEEEPVKKGKKVVKMKKVAKKSSGAGRADWDTPWRPTSVLAEAFKLAQKGTTVKDLNILAKKNDASPAYVLSALKREDYRGFTWKTKGDGKTFKVFNVVQGRAKKAA